MIRINETKFNELQGGLSDTRFASIFGINRSQLYRARNGYSAVGAGLLLEFP
jgi:hypothetical protein